MTDKKKVCFYKGNVVLYHGMYFVVKDFNDRQLRKSYRKGVEDTHYQSLRLIPFNSSNTEFGLTDIEKWECNCPDEEGYEHFDIISHECEKCHGVQAFNIYEAKCVAENIEAFIMRKVKNLFFEGKMI